MVQPQCRTLCGHAAQPRPASQAVKSASSLSLTDSTATHSTARQPRVSRTLSEGCSHVIGMNFRALHKTFLIVPKAEGLEGSRKCVLGRGRLLPSRWVCLQWCGTATMPERADTCRMLRLKFTNCMVHESSGNLLLRHWCAHLQSQSLGGAGKRAGVQPQLYSKSEAYLS